MKQPFLGIELALIAICITIAVILMATIAHAETTYCASHEKMAEILKTKYNEYATGQGTAGPTSLLELYVSAKHTFTLVAVNTSGMACIVGAGDNWEEFKSDKGPALW